MRNLVGLAGGCARAMLGPTATLAIVGACLALVAGRGAPAPPSARRQAIYVALWHAEVEAGEEAGRLTPHADGPEGPDALLPRRRAAFDRLAALARRRLASDFGITVEELAQIRVEGDREGWEVE